MEEKGRVIFTPDNEPYLGNEAIYHFDIAIVETCKLNMLLASYTQIHRKALSDVQKASCEIIPQGISIALSIRELIRQAYLLSAQILLRPLMERVATISYLQSNREAIDVWEDGWKFKKRPSLKKMMKTLGIDEGDIVTICQEHNDLVHGNPRSSLCNRVNTDHDKWSYASGKIIDNPKVAELIAVETLSYLKLIGNSLLSIFPISDDTLQTTFNSQFRCKHDLFVRLIVEAVRRKEDYINSLKET